MSTLSGRPLATASHAAEVGALRAQKLTQEIVRRVGIRESSVSPDPRGCPSHQVTR
jgi:hypothetical protein